MSGFVRCLPRKGSNVIFNEKPKTLAQYDFLSSVPFVSYHYTNGTYTSPNNTEFSVYYPSGTRKPDSGDDAEGVGIPMVNLDFMKRYRLSFKIKADTTFTANTQNGVKVVTAIGDVLPDHSKDLFNCTETGIEQAVANKISWTSETTQWATKTIDFGCCDGVAVAMFDFSWPRTGAITHYVRDMAISEISSAITSISCNMNYSAEHRQYVKCILTLKGYTVSEPTVIPVRYHITGKCTHSVFNVFGANYGVSGNANVDAYFTTLVTITPSNGYICQLELENLSASELDDSLNVSVEVGYQGSEIEAWYYYTEDDQEPPTGDDDDDDPDEAPEVDDENP